MKDKENFSHHRMEGLSKRDIERWMRRRQFQMVDFQGEDFRTSTFWGGKEIFYKIDCQNDADVYFREGSLGGLIVIEMQVMSSEIALRGYCPWLIFGLFNVKWSFKDRPLSWMKYRQEGFYDMRALKSWLDQSVS